ncbi:hypothetical protein BJF78_05050 [Pseudonocardia sp. CNS-139]|nr:hypothetical protein BJF78_05050 [Pseudonocardia sp. CNS-139]
MAERGFRRGWWVAALFAVPTVLAGVALGWPGPQLADGLRARSAAALDAAGLPDVHVALDGRDARLGNVPAGAEGSAVSAVGGVGGVRTVELLAPAVPPRGTAPTATGPTAPAEPGVPTPAERERLAAALAALGPVLFAPDSAELTASAHRTVARAAALLVAVPGVPVLVEGHVASTPDATEAGVRLAERRAAAVADELAAAGVDPGRVTARGRGAEVPRATAALSRRAEISPDG